MKVIGKYNNTVFNNPRNSKVQLVSFLVVIICGFYMRAKGLGDDSFFIDELYHVYAADSFNDNGTLSLPSGMLYNRASLYTYFVSFSFRLFGLSEFSARLPSVVFGLFYLVLFYYFVRKLFSEHVAILSAILVFLSPFELYYSSECRSYSLFQLLYLVESYLFFKIFCCSDKQNKSIIKNICVNVSKKSVFFLMLLLTVWFSSNLLEYYMLFFLAILLFLGFLGTEKVFAKRCFNRKSLVFTTIGLFFVIVITLFSFRDHFSYLVCQKVFIPKWGEQSADDYLFYFRVLFRQTFLICLLVPVGFFAAIYNNYRNTVYITCLFLVPFIIVSFLPLKTARLIYFAYPLLFIFVSVSILFVFNLFLEKIKKRTKDRKGNLLTGVFVFTFIFAIVLNYVVSYKYSRFNLPAKPDWRGVSSILNDKVRPQDYIIADNSIAAKYYLGKIDYVIDENLLQISQNSRYKDVDGRWLDYYTNAVHITGVDELTELINSGIVGFVLFGHAGSGFEEIKRFVKENKRNFEEIFSKKKIKVYRIKESIQ